MNSDDDSPLEIRKNIGAIMQIVAQMQTELQRELAAIRNELAQIRRNTNPER